MIDFLLALRAEFDGLTIGQRHIRLAPVSPLA
jgi:hypothetical protein